VLDEVLQQVGLDRQTVYITNAVKHFRFEQRGKMRLHKSPTAKQAAACLPWLEAELAQVQPQVVVCLGATAAKRLIGSTFRITQEHGEFRRTRWSDLTLATYHPSAVLRARDPAGGDAIRATMIEDLTAVVQQLAA
jgi:DNA polymerase